jgi:hypothetical protein
MTIPPRYWCWISKLRDANAVAVALSFVLMIAIASTQSARAQTFTVLHGFGGGNDGAAPYAGLIRDAAGNLYGTTSSGFGTSTYGTVFKLDKYGTETILYVFKGGE